MRILLIGGPSNDPKASAFDWSSSFREIGRQIARSEHHLLVCSSYEASADRHAFDGFVEAGGSARRLVVYPPANPPEVQHEWQALLRDAKVPTAAIVAVPGPDATNPSTRSNAYLLAQLAALEDSDVIVAVGGGLGGSAVISLAIATAREKSVLPFDFVGGAARDALVRQRDSLITLLGEKFGHLYEADGVAHCVEIAELLRNPSRERPTYVFLSYSWARSDAADLVEVALRSHGVKVFRDERNVGPGADFPAEIAEALDVCTHFIAVWCQEYAISPHCYDELHHVLERRRKDEGLEVLLLRFDETRFAWKALRDYAGPGSVAKNWPRVEVKDRAVVREAVARFLGRTHDAVVDESVGGR